MGRGFTLFKPLGIKTNLEMDFDKKLGMGTIIYEGKTLMTVTINVQSNTVEVAGSVSEISHLTTTDGINSMDEAAYIRMFKSQTEYCIENNQKDY